MCSPVCQQVLSCCNFFVDSMKNDSKARLFIITLVALIALFILANIYLF